MYLKEHHEPISGKPLCASSSKGWLQCTFILHVHTNMIYTLSSRKKATCKALISTKFELFFFLRRIFCSIFIMPAEKNINFFQITWDQGPGFHSGGQSWLLHTCICAGVLTGHREWATTSSLWKVLFWTHSTWRLCCPPPQVLLHMLHSPADQLKGGNMS